MRRGCGGKILGKTVISPVDFETINPNLLFGVINGAIQYPSQKVLLKKRTDPYSNNPMVDGFIYRLVSEPSRDAKQMVVCALYARYLKRIGSHLMDMACTITASAYHEMKKKRG